MLGANVSCSSMTPSQREVEARAAAQALHHELGNLWLSDMKQIAFFRIPEAYRVI